MTIREFKRAIFIFLLACGWLAAQKGQTSASPGQGGGGSQQPSIPPQLYPIDQLPRTRQQAEANLTGNVLHALGPSGRTKGGYKPWNRRSPPRYIWYRATETKSYAIPVILVPMTCKDKPPKWDDPLPAEPDAKILENRDPDFIEGCKDVDNKRTPSQPTQNWNPLKLGDGAILAIYDGDGLLLQYDVRLLGMTIQSQNGSTLYPDALQPAIVANPASPPSGGGGSQAAQGAGGAAASGEANSGCGRQAIAKAGKLDGGSPSGPFYYIPWTGNPLLGDTVLSVAIVAQAPSTVPLTVGFSVSGEISPGGKPSEPKIKVCDVSYAGPITTGFPSGSTVRVAVVKADNPGYTFVRWSDGGRQSHDVVIGSSPMNVTAEFARNGKFTVPVTVFSNPRGANISRPDGCTGGEAPVFDCPAGEIKVSAPGSQMLNGGLQQVQSWSDGGEDTAKECVPPVALAPGWNCPITVTVGKEPVTLVANYGNSWQLAPSTASLTLDANTNGLLASVNGIGYVLQQLPPVVLPVAAGTSMHLYAPPKQQLGSKEYNLGNWSPPVTAPFPAVAGGSRYTATFNQGTFAGSCTLPMATSPAGLFVGVGYGADEVFAATGGTPAVTPAVVKIPYPAGTVPAAGGSITATATVDASLPQYLNGALYTFQGWSDGGAAQHPVDFTMTALPGATAWTCSTQPTLTATFALSTSGTAIPVTVSTDPPGLWFSVNGISKNRPAVGFFAPGSTVALSTASTQSLSGVQYTFAGWSDSSTSTATSHSFSVAAGGQQNGNSTPATGGTPSTAGQGNQSTQNPPASAAVTAVFAPATPGPTEQPLTLLNTTFPQTHNLSRYNLASGMIYSWSRNQSWSRQETAPAVTCPTGSPQPCIPSPELYQTVLNPPGTHTVAPVLFFMIYTRRLDSERKWHPWDLMPALNLGLSLTSPSTDFFVGASSEVLFRGFQLNVGMHIGQISRLSQAGINDPTSSAAPVTIQQFQKSAYVGVTFNVNFIQTLFSAAKGGG